MSLDSVKEDCVALSLLDYKLIGLEEAAGFQVAI